MARQAPHQRSRPPHGIYSTVHTQYILLCTYIHSIYIHACMHTYLHTYTYTMYCNPRFLSPACCTARSFQTVLATPTRKRDLSPGKTEWIPSSSYPFQNKISKLIVDPAPAILDLHLHSPCQPKV